MRKFQSLMLIVTLLLISACDKTNCIQEQSSCEFDTDLGTSKSVLPESQLLEYFEIWKELLLEKNAMTLDYFNAHITDYRLSSHSWNGGISFRIDYIMQIDWVAIKCSDQFLVKMNSAYDLYTHLNIPRDVFLNSEEIKFNIEKDVHSAVNPYNLNEGLKYNNCQEIYNAVNESQEMNIQLDYVTYYVGGKLPRIDGDPYCMLSGRVCNSKDDCWFGYINLVTGEKEIWKSSCVIVG